MSVTPELIKSKLSSVDQSADTIVSVSSWLLFHRRSAALIVQTWLQAVRDEIIHHQNLSRLIIGGSSNRKLSLIYLANEVSQQSRAKKRPEYPAEFGRAMPEAIENVFRHATSDVQGKILRVIDVWRQRSIYSEDVLLAIEQRTSNKDKPVSKATSLSAGVPAELAEAAGQYTKLFGCTSSSSLAVGTANSLYSNLFDDQSESTRPSPDLYAAKLRQLEASLKLASTTVQASIAARQELVTQLQSLLQRNTTALEKDERTAGEIISQLEHVESATRDTAKAIADAEVHTARSTTPDMSPPTPEALTPPAQDPTMTEALERSNGDGESALDPVAKMQMELDPTIAALLARQTAETQDDNGDEDAYIP